MLIIPAIDLKSGKVVRLYQGDYNKEKIYSEDPAEVAEYWQGQGAKLIHLVDLDGARSGSPENLDTAGKIIKAIKIPVEFGGGARNEETVKKILDAGASRVVLGTVALEDRNLLKKLINQYRQKVIVSVDVGKDGAVASRGWTESVSGENSLANFIKSLAGIGVKELIYTDIERDGTLDGARHEQLADYMRLFKMYNIAIIMAGGVSSLADIKALKKLENHGLAGIIVGKALYEKKFTLKEAIDL